MEQGAGEGAVMATVKIVLDTQYRFRYTLEYAVLWAHLQHSGY